MRAAPALLVVLVLLAGCGDDASIDEVVDGAEVVVIGDSVTEQSADAIVAAMGDRETEVLGRSGYRTDELLPVAEEALAEDPPVAVVMAGYNDVWQGRDREAPVAELVDVVAVADCAVWVLVPTEGPWDRARARAFERRVRAAAEAAGVAVETGWRDAVDVADGPDPALVVPDGVHPSEAGQRRLAEVVAAAVDRECG